MVRPTTVTVSVQTNGTARVLWATKSDMCYRTLASQEEAEHFAAGVQAGIVSMGGSATVEIVEVRDVEA
jgi:hypothetical protein